MDDVEKVEKQNQESYIVALETTVNDLTEKIEKIQHEKEQLFDKYISSVAKLFNIGGT